MKLDIKQMVFGDRYRPGTMREICRRIEDAVNILAEGRLAGRYFNATTVPTTGSFAQGDIVWKANPTEAGTTPNKYVVIGWICTVAGTPGTLLEMRVLTGN